MTFFQTERLCIDWLCSAEIGIFNLTTSRPNGSASEIKINGTMIFAWPDFVKVHGIKIITCPR
jgi:hypothetical protein